MTGCSKICSRGVILTGPNSALTGSVILIPSEAIVETTFICSLCKAKVNCRESDLFVSSTRKCFSLLETVNVTKKLISPFSVFVIFCGAGGFL